LKQKKEILLPPLVCPRPADSPGFDHDSLNWIEAPLLDISATFIRESNKDDFSVRYLLPEKEEEYLRDRKLYF